MIIIVNNNNYNNIKEITKMFIDNSNNLFIGVLSGIVTGYILFQAISEKRSMINLLLKDDESITHESKFEKLNNSFIEMIIGIFIFLVFNYFLNILNYIVNITAFGLFYKALFFIIYFIYILFFINILIEFICLIYNLYNIILMDVLIGLAEKKDNELE